MFPEINTEHFSGTLTGNITSSYKGKTGKINVIEDVEYDLDDIPDSEFSKATAGLFCEIYNGKSVVLPLSFFLN